MTTSTETHSAPLPACRATLICTECGAEIGSLSLGETHFLTDVFRLRREHAKERHGWEGSS